MRFAFYPFASKVEYMDPQSLLIPLLRPDLANLEPYASAGMEAGKRDDAVYLNASENPFSLPELEGLNRYPEPQPAKLLTALADLYGVAADRILASRGEDEAIDLLVRTFCTPGRDKILICPPTFPMYGFSARLQNADVLSVPLRKMPGGVFEIDIQSIVSAIHAGKGAIRIVFLCSPNNPTGGSLDRSVMLDLCRAVAGKAAVVVDEAYIEFSEQPSVTADMEAHPNLIVLRTLSKAHALAGERIGATLCADRAFMSFLRRIIAPYPIPRTAIASALLALSPAALARTREVIAILRTERSRLAASLAVSSLVRKVYPSDANFLLVEMTAPKDFVAFCAKKSLFIRDRSSVAGIEGCVRISVGAPEENDFLLSCLARHAAVENLETTGNDRHGREQA